MFCPQCGTRARVGQKFCVECGFDLRTHPDWRAEHDEHMPTAVLPATEDDPDDGSGVDGDGVDHGELDDGELADGPITGETAVIEVVAEQAEPRVEVPTIQTADDEVEIAVRDEVTRGMGRAVDPLLARGLGSSTPGGREWSPTGQQRTVPPAPPVDWQQDPDVTSRLPGTPLTEDDWPTRRDIPAVGDDRTTAYDVPAGMTTAPQPRVVGRWDQLPDGDATSASSPPRRFRPRVVLGAAALAVAAAVAGLTQILIEIVPGAPVAGLEAGTWMVNDFGTNNTVAAIVALVAIALGAILWCFGFRAGAGLAGGGGLALTGWAALLLGLAEWQLADAERIGAGVGLTITRDIGYWGLVAAGAAGVVTFLASLSGSGRDPGGGLDPWVAALGAASVLVAAGGPLIPLGGADITGNYNSSSLGVLLPDLFFVGRLVQLGLFAFTGIIGFLLVRRYGLGLVVGGATVAGFQVVTAALEQTASPIGPGYANPGATAGLTPHGVTVVGMAIAGFFALVAVIMAVLDRPGRG
ncbi:MAG: hypothetical protein ACK5OX_17275 [Desertimonas sp.]